MSIVNFKHIHTMIWYFYCDSEQVNIGWVNKLINKETTKHGVL